MIKSGKHQFVIAMILAFISFSASGVEHNLPKTKPRFEINSEEQQWQVEGDKIGKGPIKPTHVAELFLPYSDEYVSNSNSRRCPCRSWRFIGYSLGS
ncbi:MAG TPA: hypothetical protein VMW72_15055 [Sedimentisphaerales bacterium]|nr:hypothetical protein [Sedimentisphaerales bacterium]